MTKPLSKIRVVYTEGDAAKGRHDIAAHNATGAEASEARRIASGLALTGRRGGYDVSVIEFYQDGSKFFFDIA